MKTTPTLTCLKGVEDQIIKGMYQYSKASGKAKNKVQLMGSGVILREVIEAAQLLESDWGVESDVWSVTSFTELTSQCFGC